MYLSLLLKLHLATFSHWERSFWASVASHSHNLLSCTKHSLVFLEALKKWFCAFKLQNDFFCKKAQTHENLSSALQKTVHFIRKTFFMYLSFALKIAFSNFFSLRKKFLSVCGPRILMICSWKSVFCLQKTVCISLERNIFHALALKIAFSNFFSLRNFLSICGLAFS